MRGMRGDKKKDHFSEFLCSVRRHKSLPLSRASQIFPGDTVTLSQGSKMLKYGIFASNCYTLELKLQTTVSLYLMLSTQMEVYS